MASVVVRVESQELLVDLVEEPGKTSPSTLSAVSQTGRGAQVLLFLWQEAHKHVSLCDPTMQWSMVAT